jgi:hypothetical protein
VSDVSQLITSSRKYVVPQYFDSSGVTIRTGDYRALRRRRIGEP